MNSLMIIIILVFFCYFGDSYCPSVLKKNKEILLGIAGGLVLCSFFGMRIEGVPDGKYEMGDIEQCENMGSEARIFLNLNRPRGDCGISNDKMNLTCNAEGCYTKESLDIGEFRNANVNG